MKRIAYVNTSVLVGDDFGSALLEYAAALARSGTSETIVFRGVSEQEYREIEVSFIVGPASEIVVARVSDESPMGLEPDNAEIMATIQRRIVELKEDQDDSSKRVVTPEPMSEERTLIDGLDI
jgi:hypothetical protein